MRVFLLMLVSAVFALAGTSVSGIVVDSDGKVMHRAEVRLLNPADRKVLYETATVQGRVHFDAVAPQSYFLSVTFRGFIEHARSITVTPDEAVDAGKVVLEAGMIFFLDNVRSKLVWPEKRRLIAGYHALTVCEYLQLRSHAPYTEERLIILGILVQTPEGNYLRQTCSEHLHSGDFSWPDAIALEPAAGAQQRLVIERLGRLEWSDADRPGNDEMAPSNRQGAWVAFFGNVVTMDDLVTAPCGNGKVCGYGYGPVSAPAMLRYLYWHHFGEK
jgi:hypothetical protein